MRAPLLPAMRRTRMVLPVEHKQTAATRPWSAPALEWPLARWEAQAVLLWRWRAKGALAPARGRAAPRVTGRASSSAGSWSVRSRITRSAAIMVRLAQRSAAEVCANTITAVKPATWIATAPRIARRTKVTGSSAATTRQRATEPGAAYASAAAKMICSCVIQPLQASVKAARANLRRLGGSFLPVIMLACCNGRPLA